MKATIQEIAKQLDGIEYPVRIPLDVEKQARVNNIVIVYGASDDLMEFEGAISEEIGCYDGGEVYVDARGILPDFDGLDPKDKDAHREYFKREAGESYKIEALWCKEDGYSWTYRTDLAHATFEVMEDGDKYCRGIVFELPKRENA